MDEAGSFILCESDYLQTSFSAFQDMREKAEFTDVTIRCKTRLFSAHRVVLAARIPYFRKFLSTQENDVLESLIDPDVLESLINFAYEGKLKVTAENVQPMLLASGYLQLERVQKACLEFTSKGLNSDGDSSPSVRVVPPDLTIRERFDEFSHTENFLFLPYSFLKELVSRDDLRVTSEAKVFEAIIKWVKMAPTERQPLLPHLLTEIRMANLTPDYLVEQVATEELIQTSDQCKHIVEEAKSYHLVSRKRSLSLSFKTSPRIYIDGHQNSAHGNTSITATNENVPRDNSTDRNDSRSNTRDNSTDRNDSRSNTHENVPRDNSMDRNDSPSKTSSTATHENVPRDNSTDRNDSLYSTSSTATHGKVIIHNTARRASNQNNSRGNTVWNGIYLVCCLNSVGTAVCYHDEVSKKMQVFPISCRSKDIEGVVFVNGMIYIFFPNLVETFQLGTYERTGTQPIPVTIKGSGIVSHTNKIYIIGGFASPNTIRLFDPVQKKFLADEEMKTGRRNMGVASYLGKYICITGGFATSCCSLVEKYNPITGGWTEMPPMLFARMDHGCATLNDNIYVCGGRSDYARFLNKAEVYDRTTAQWTCISTTKVFRHSLSLVSWNGKLHAVGGVSEKELLCVQGSEVYNPENGQWASNMPIFVQKISPIIMKAVVVDPSND